MAEITARRYAKALFELAVERGTIGEYEEAANALLGALGRDSELAAFIGNPQIARQGKLALIQDALSGKVPDDFLGLITVALDKKREGSLYAILTMFLEMAREHRGITEAVVTSAVALSESQLSGIGAALTKKLNKTVIIKQLIDPGVIAGFKVSVAGMLFDATVSSRMDELRKALLQ